ncbi:MAG TPA: 2-dehydro-3-deoxygalactonokinase, partial [Acidocella sp.]|nr:2-dehydro-3-deoxygalactonokinase [Acidocella sp.]
GMAGARNGWREAPYLAVPTTLVKLSDYAVRAPTSFEAHILPGLVRRDLDAADVMRGEETQMLGFTASFPEFSGLVCLPGTHCKWVTVQTGQVVDFFSSMTGEVYQLLSRYSVLRHGLHEGDFVDPKAPEFIQAAQVCLKKPEFLLHSLLSVRAAALVSGMSPLAAAARLSGLLIGADVGAVLRCLKPENEIRLIASGPQAILYARVFALAGIQVLNLDADTMVRKGLLEAARLLHNTEMQP